MNPRPFSAVKYERAKDLSLCLRCVVLFADPKNESILLESEEAIMSHLVEHRLLPTATAEDIANDFPGAREIPCPCCLGYLQPSALQQLALQISSALHAGITPLPGEVLSTVQLILNLPTTFDVLRISVRTVLTRVPEKTEPFPSFAELMFRLLNITLQRTCNIKAVEEVASNQVVIDMRLITEGDMCRVVCPYCFQFYKKCGGKDNTLKRTAAEMEADEAVPQERPELAPRRFLDQIIIEHKKMTGDRDLLELQNRIKAFFRSPVYEKTPLVSVDITALKAPIYLLGRYRKLSRDVPQSRWDVDAKVPDGGAEKDTIAETVGDKPAEPKADVDEDCLRVRKGRNSVEEIIVDSLCTIFGTSAANLKMHGCGREDIDVRMLGNGRPFVVECANLKSGVTSQMLSAALDRIATGGGLNDNFDVEVTWLSEVPKSVWEGMQTVAEEKCKAYCCVVWSEKPITADVLNEKLSALPRQSGGTDEDGIECLEIEQLTPLRVLHRRSLLRRKRHIYSMNAVPLNENYFLLQVVTSAGTYVKEFVHGDFGRSEPSVASILGWRTDITQLDVTWLYDDFGELACNSDLSFVSNQKSGGTIGSGASATVADLSDIPSPPANNKIESLRQVKEAGNNIKWDHLRAATRASQRVSFVKQR